MNAKRFYGQETCTYGDDEFEKLIDLGRARHGAAIGVASIARYLGIKRTVTSRDDPVFPFTFACFPPNLACHAVLAISGDKEFWEVVNYYGPYGPVVDRIKISQLDIVSTWPGCDHGFRQFWHLEIENET